MQGNSMEGGVSIRAVKLKVLYTFDVEHKNNHLARWPHSLEVQAAPIDETSLIGIVNLRTCLDAVITASPELTSNLDNDYTVYAYDYSEPDTPLVGQGMLSKALLQDTSGAADSEAMVTGRISKSVMGLFSKNALETLEVKLRLTPMASPTYQHRRSGSISSNAEGVQQQWNSLSQTNGAFRPSSPMSTAGLETMQRMLSESVPARSGSFQQEAFHDSHSRPVSRSGTPVQQFNAPARHSSIQSRPGSRAEMRQVSHNRRDSINSGYFSGEENVEEGPVRKRARIQKVDIPAKSNLNIERQPDSLRVVASTASSVRLHRPTPQYPGVAALQNSNLLEEPVRPPTPIAKAKPIRPRGRPRKIISANLMRGPAARRSSPARQQREETVDPSLSSPEDARAASITSTPADLPSSPPVMPEQQNFVTSPALPPLMGETDSGFMSGNLDDLFNDQLIDFDEFIQDNKTDFPEEDQGMDFRTHATMAADLPAVFDESNDPAPNSADMPPPTEKPEFNPVPRTFARSHSYTPGHRAVMPTPRLAAVLAPANNRTATNHGTTQLSKSALSQIPASDPVERTLHRSNTWAPDMSDTIMSDFGPTREEQSEGKSKKKVGKAQTKARLENAIAAGQMPPFCDNCGAIETPAWRRAFTKIYDSPYDDFQTSLEPGECCYKEPVEHNADGSVKRWKGYRSEKRNDEKSAENDGWVQICLCNPCGLWFHKSKCPRPPEKWQKRDPNEKRKRKRGPKNKRGSNLNRPILRSDAPTPASDDSSPADGEGEDYGDNMTTNDEPTDDNEPQLPPMPPAYRAGSAEPTDMRQHGKISRPSLRQVQSSPIPGHQRTAPIELDLTPKPLRRQLFPSPDSLKNRAKAVSVLGPAMSDNRLPTFVRRSPRLNKIRDVFAGGQPTALVPVDGAEKENIAPVATPDHDLTDLFEYPDDDFVMPPTTPTPKRRSDRIVFKTPGKTPSREFGAAVSPNVPERIMKTPKAKHPAADILISTVQRDLTPAQMTPFTRSIHEALNNSVTFEFDRTPQAPRSGRPKRTPNKNTSASAKDDFDFPELPSLNGSSPMCADTGFGINFSELTTDHLTTDYNDVFSTDAPMPSSPPPGYFDFLHNKDAEFNEFWNDMGEDNMQVAFGDAHKDSFLAVSASHGGPRRSPRKQKRNS